MELEATSAGLFRALARLDDVLRRAVEVARELYRRRPRPRSCPGCTSTTRRSSGCSTAPRERRCLGAAGGLGELDADDERMAWLRRAFELTAFELQVAPHRARAGGRPALRADLRLPPGRRDPQAADGRPRPAACSARAPEARIADRAVFAHGRDADPRASSSGWSRPEGTADPPLLAHAVRVDEQVVRLLLGRAASSTAGSAGWPSWSMPSTRTTPTSCRTAPASDWRGWPSTAARSAAPSACTSRERAGRAVAGRRRRSRRRSACDCWWSTCSSCRRDHDEVDRLLRLVVPRGAGSSTRCCSWTASIASTRPAARRRPAVRPARRRSRPTRPTSSCSGASARGSRRPRPHGHADGADPRPGVRRARVAWRRRLADAGVAIPAADIAALAERFRLTSDQIADAVRSPTRVRAGEALDRRSATGRRPAERRGDGGGPVRGGARRSRAPRLGDRAPSRSGPPGLGRHRAARRDASSSCASMCASGAAPAAGARRLGLRPRGCRSARASTRCSPGRPGTGKTMAAEVIAGELGLDLYKIDLSRRRQQVHRRDREEPRARSSARPQDANAILFFDEADALFGKRSEVRDAHDRYANIEIATCCSGWSSTRASRSSPPTCARTWTRRSSAGSQFIVEFPFPDEERPAADLGGRCSRPTRRATADVDFAALGARVPARRRQHQEHRRSARRSSPRTDGEPIGDGPPAAGDPPRAAEDGPGRGVRRFEVTPSC